MKGKTSILIKNGRIYDPSQNINGKKMDIHISGGRISESNDNPGIVIDAGERAVLSGGIDPCCYAANPGQYILRMNGLVPPAGDIGNAYAKCGYTHIHQPIMTLLTAGTVRHTLSRIPFLDKSAWISLDFRDTGKYIKGNNIPEFIILSKALASMTGALGMVLPFPFLKHKQRHYMHMNISIKKTFEFITGIEDDDFRKISLWGQPGLFSADFIKPERFHIADLGRAITTEEDYARAVEFLEAGGSASIKLATGRDGLSIDPVNSPGENRFTFDLGLHYPLSYAIKNYSVNNENSMLLWKLAAEMKPHWSLSLSDSGIPGSTQNTVPEAAAWLMNPESGPSELRDILSGSPFGLYEYARLTRSEPALQLGIDDAGTLKPGARANIAIYDIKNGSKQDNLKDSLSNCRLLIKDGTIVIKDGEFTGERPEENLIRADIEADLSLLTGSDLFQRPTMRWENLAVESHP